jgi:hypothetical protein
MEMKSVILAAAMMIGASALAHDEGHGPKQSVVGNKGGVVAAVVAKSEASKGPKATLVYRAELIRLPDNGVQIFLYKEKLDDKGRLDSLDLSSFQKNATAALLTPIKGKKGKMKETSFSLELKDGSFVGKMPKPEGKPYNIDVTLKDASQELLSAFDNLD